MGIPFGFGVRMLMDAHLQYWRPGLPVALRIKNFVEPEEGYVEFGFQISPTGQLSDNTGFTDVRILPQPEVKEADTKDIGVDQAQLQFGAKTFSISHTFVRARMNEMNYSDPYQVFRDPSVLGIAYPFTPPPRQPQLQARLFAIKSITHEEVAGHTLLWNLVCIGQETLVSVPGS